MKLSEKPTGCLVGTPGWLAVSCHGWEIIGEEREQDAGTLPY